LGYFSSEIGATQSLNYVEVPGRYDGCIDYNKGDKAYAIG
ncbi:MAG TPA: twin-arginine translocation pathway signal protein, partial [Algoriphagus sp.]|nr:twin-arginine translocation pathway signal protein [Algoriphagus sp.]